MKRFSRKIEEEIKKAIESGAFENLPGKGEPLDLQDNPHVSDEWRLTHHLLRSNDFSLPWIQRRQEIEQGIQEARSTLARVWEWSQGDKPRSEQAAPDDRAWNQALEAFRQEIAALNYQIRDYNLEAPSPRFHLVPLKRHRRFVRLLGTGSLHRDITK